MCFELFVNILVLRTKTKDKKQRDKQKWQIKILIIKAIKKMREKGTWSRWVEFQT